MHLPLLKRNRVEFLTPIFVDSQPYIYSKGRQIFRMFPARNSNIMPFCIKNWKCTRTLLFIVVGWPNVACIFKLIWGLEEWLSKTGVQC